MSDVSALRWSATKDVIHVIEQLAIEAEASAANIAGELDRVEDEFFLQDIFSILRIKTNHFGSAQESLLVLAQPKGELNLILLAHMQILDCNRSI